MKWKTNRIPRSGEKSTIRRFAFLPKKLDDGYTVWLEHYYALEVWDDGTTSTEHNGYWKLRHTSLYHPDRPNTGTPTR
jgi:hypothetical protein